MPPVTLTAELVDFDVAVGAAIRARRTLRSWSQGDLALAANTARPIVSRVECGRHTLSVATLLRYARALHCRSSDLLRDAEQLCKSTPNGQARAHAIADAESRS